MALEIELAAYADMKDQLLSAHEGKFVLLHTQDLLGTFDSVEVAYSEGVRRFGREPFLVKKVTVHDELYRNQALSLGLVNGRI